MFISQEIFKSIIADFVSSLELMTSEIFFRKKNRSQGK